MRTRVPRLERPRDYSHILLINVQLFAAAATRMRRRFCIDHALISHLLHTDLRFRQVGWHDRGLDRSSRLSLSPDSPGTGFRAAPASCSQHTRTLLGRGCHSSEIREKLPSPAITRVMMGGSLA